MATDPGMGAEDPLASLIEAIPDGISVLDLDGQQLLVHRAFCEMTGFSREEMIGVGPPLPYWPPEQLPDILRRATEPLFTTKPSGEGTGLGLSMAQKFASDAEGHLEIRSTPGTGTKVAMLFPLLHPIRATVLDASEPSDEARIGSTAAGNGEGILVVQDEENLLQFLSASLSDLGYRVWTAQSPRQALALLGEREIDLVVSDTGLAQRMSGVEMARRARVLRPNARLLFISGYLDPQQEQSARKLGPILRKPFEVQAFWNAVRKVLDDGSSSERRPQTDG